jgi:3-deoxy-D-manno-octulosonic-acid transferase
MVLEAWSKVRAHYPGALLILAPRHPARFDEVARILSAGGHSFVRRTRLASPDAAEVSRMAVSEVLLLDSIGELAGVLELADVVFMGGSLVPTGGHNILEAACWAKPVLFGPHMENFRDIARFFLDAQACLQVRDGNELATSVMRLFADPTAARELGERGRQVLAQHAGATARVLQQIQRLLEAPVTQGRER